MSDFRHRFWVETAVAVASVALFIVTLFVPDWIELVFRVDPDGRSGAAEWAVLAVLLAAALVASTLAYHEWRRPRGASASIS